MKTKGNRKRCDTFIQDDLTKNEAEIRKQLKKKVWEEIYKHEQLSAKNMASNFVQGL